MGDFETKDSGSRQHWDSGMQRDTEEGKARFDLLHPVGVPYADQLLTRFAELMGRGAVKYEDRNWEKANSEAEISRAKSSAARHFEQWLTGETDEDHAAAVMFNLLVVETTSWKLQQQEEEDLEVKWGDLGRPWDLTDLQPHLEQMRADTNAMVGRLFDRTKFYGVDGAEAVPTEAGDPSRWYSNIELDRDLVEGNFGPDLLKKHPTRWSRG